MYAFRRFSALFVPGSYTPPSDSGGSGNNLPRVPSPKRNSSDMPPERSRGTSRKPSSDLRYNEMASSSTGGRRRGSEDKLRKESGKVNIHEMWLDSGKKEKDRKEKEKEKKEREREVERERERESKDKDKDKGSSRKSKDTIRTLQKDKETLSVYVRDLQTQLQGIEDQDRLMQTRYRMLEDEIQALNKKSRQDDEEIQNLVDTSMRAAEAAARHIQDVEHQNHDLQDQLRQMREKLQKAEEAQRADARTEETMPRATQVFMSKADSYAGAEIIRMVETLNAEVLQCAAFVAEAVMAAEIRIKEDERTLEKCRKRTSDRVGQRLMLAMRHNVDTDARDPLPLQLALQHTILVWSCHIVQSFTPENQDLNRQLAGIWGKVCMKEEPAVAGKWRAIMAAQLRGPSTMYRGIYDDCKYTMVAGGWSTKAANATTLAASIQARLMAVESSIMKLKEAVTEGVTSTEVVPCMWPPGQAYDPAEMDSAYPDASDGELAQKGIVCSTDLGVKRLAVARLADGSLSRTYETLLRPKVILSSALDIAD